MTPTPYFGHLLRHYRIEAGLTQEALAEGAGLSARAISDLERGLRHAPHRETVRLLAGALGLDATARELLEAAARRPRHPVVLPEHSGEAPGFAPGLPARLVGRTREVEALRTKLEGALAGCGGLVLLAGEPGIGKTRLVEELAAEAGQRRIQVLWGRCWESEGAPPFWPWVEILRGVVRSRESPVLQAELGSGASLLAELVPEVREPASGGPDLLPAPLLEAGEARFRLFDSITAALQNASRSQPLLLILEDLHWADKPSLLLLQFLLQYIGNSRVLIVGTYRDTELDSHHPLAEVLGSLPRQRSFESMPLKGLTVEAVSALVNSCLNQSVSVDEPALARALWQATEGNPLFVREELRFLLEDDRLLRNGKDWEGAARIPELGLPQGVRDVISRRLSRLSEATRDLLIVAAVIGREFEAAILERSSGLDEAGMDAALDEAQAARVIEEPQRTVGRYRFSHALFREALYAELPARRRIRLHRQVAEALERAYTGVLDAHLSELAYHYGEAQALLGTDKLVHYSLLAGERALAGYAFEEALGHFQRGLEATAGQPMDADQAALLFGLGRAQEATLELLRAHEVIASLSRAFEYYAAVGDVDRAVAVAECPVDALPGQSVGAARLVARALALVQPDSHAAGRLLARYARMAAIEEGNHEAASEACTRAVAIAQREGDIPLEIRALANGAEADLNYLRFHEGLEKCLRAIDLAGRADDLFAEMLARFFAGLLLWFLGDCPRASEQAAALLARAEQSRDPRWIVNATWMNGTLARFRGDWAATQDFTDRGLALSPADPRLLWTRILLEHDIGGFAAAEPLLEMLAEIAPLTMPRPDLVNATTVLVSAVVDDGGSAVGRLRLAEAAGEAILPSPPATLAISRFARAGLAVIAVRRGDAATSGRHYRALEPARGTIIFVAIAADRLLGLLAATMGNHDAAEAHFEDALAICRSGGLRPEYARTCYDYAELLRDRGGPGDYE